MDRVDRIPVAAVRHHRAVPRGVALTVPGLRRLAGIRLRLCARAASISPTGESEPTFFTRALVTMLVTNHPSVNERDLRRVAATLRYFASAQFWARMRTGFEMSAPAISDVFDRTVVQAMGDLFDRSRASR